MRAHHQKRRRTKFTRAMTATSEVAFDAPVISTRSVETALLIKDGQTVALGGLTDTQRDVNCPEFLKTQRTESPEKPGRFIAPQAGAAHGLRTNLRSQGEQLAPITKIHAESI